MEVLVGIKSKNIMKTLLAIITLTLFTTVLSKGQDLQYSFKEAYDIATPAQVSISYSDGNIEAVSSEGKKTEIFYIVKKNNNCSNRK
jgi:hypothetical protein